MKDLGLGQARPYLVIVVKSRGVLLFITWTNEIMIGEGGRGNEEERGNEEGQ